MSGYDPSREGSPTRTWAPPAYDPAYDPRWQYPPPPPPRSRARAGALVPALATVTALVIALGALAGTGMLSWGSLRQLVASSAGAVWNRVGGAGQAGQAGGAQQVGNEPLGSPGGSAGSGGPVSVVSVTAKVNPAVVLINATYSYQQALGAGTGIVLTSDGEVLTNNHVINGATRIQATDEGNGRTYIATVVGYDATHDLAVLRLRGASGLPTARIGDSTRLTTGQPVVAIGNAGGTGTLTPAAGTITSLGRSITASDEVSGVTEQLSGLIEVNAAIQPGDSGGPLADASGRVIGVDTAASAAMRFQGAGGGQGFAIPIAQALATVRQIEAGRASTTVHIGSTAFLGVLLGTGRGAAGQGQGNGQGFGSGTVTGATIAGVIRGGAADRAGLVAGDVITSLNGRAIDSATTLSSVMAKLRPGERVRIGWLDGTGASRATRILLGAGPPA